MLAGKTKEELVNNLIPVVKKVEPKRKLIKYIQEYMSTYNVLPGDTLNFISNPENLLRVDQRLLYLFSDAIYRTIPNPNINPRIFFTDAEMKRSRLYDDSLYVEDAMDYPIVLEGFKQINRNAWQGHFSVKFIGKLMSNQKLNYNFDIQREAKIKYNPIFENGIIKKPTINQGNIDEITTNLVTGKQEITTIVINAQLGSADNGIEIEYDPVTEKLLIMDGTVLDVVDGYHRCKACVSALQIKPEIEFSFMILLLNYPTKKARKYQAQFAKQMPINIDRQKALAQDRSGDEIVQIIQDNSDLNEYKIAQTGDVDYSKGQIVSYSVLADTIDKYFKPVTRKETQQIGEYLARFFDELIGSYPEEFILNVEETSKKSLINTNSMFVGYIVLAKRMLDEHIPLSQLVNIIGNIDFNRSNPLWEELNIIAKRSDKRYKSGHRKEIESYFNELELINYKESDVVKK